MTTQPTKQERSQVASIMGKKGGRALAKKYGKEYMKRISENGTRALRKLVKARKLSTV